MTESGNKPSIHPLKPALGVIYSLNGAPPTWGLEDVFELKPGTPAELAVWLLEGRIAAGFVPVVEALEMGQRWVGLPYVIASPGPVRSVCLFGFENEDPLRAHTLFLDAKSRTSNALARWLLPGAALRHHGGDSQGLAHLHSGEAALVMGDEALRMVLAGRPHLDLASLWQARTGEPLVFARLMANPELLDDDAQRLLCQRVEANLLALPERVPTLAAAFGFEAAAARDYLEQNIEYTFTHAHQHGLSVLSAALRQPAPAPRHTARTGGVIGFEWRQGRRLSFSDALWLAQNAPLNELAAMATQARQRHRPGRAVSYIIERNINYTNVCNVYCRFCAFYAAPGKPGGYVLSREALAEKLNELVAAGGVQVLLQGGLNPALRLDYYESLFRFIKQGWGVALHALSPDEVLNIARLENMPVRDVLARLQQAGLDSLPGAGGEILEPRTRQRIARKKSTADEWLGVMAEAHRAGMKTSATMMYGVGEDWPARLVHLQRLRQLQDLTGGFMAFITWPYQQGELRLKATHRGEEEYLRTQAICRLFLDNVAHVQASWVTMGPQVAARALGFGADDFGSVMFEENVVSAAGTTFCMNEENIRRHILEAGYEPVRRGRNYQLLAS